MGHLMQLRATALGVGMSIAIFPPTQILSDPIDDSTANVAQLRRGQYLVAAGDCMSCHLRPGGEPLAGGLGLKTPFGVIYTPNITSDKETGIGNWTADQFFHAMHDGIDDEGNNLYRHFPIPGSGWSAARMLMPFSLF
jgi:mono/diheme cytochrome c family protein